MMLFAQKIVEHSILDVLQSFNMLLQNILSFRGILHYFRKRFTLDVWQGH